MRRFRVVVGVVLVAASLLAGCAQPCAGKSEPEYVAAWSQAFASDAMARAFGQANWTIAPESSMTDARDHVDANASLPGGGLLTASWVQIPGHHETELVVRAIGPLVGTDKEARAVLEGPLAGLRAALAGALPQPSSERYLREGGPCPPGTHGEIVAP